MPSDRQGPPSFAVGTRRDPEKKRPSCCTPAAGEPPIDEYDAEDLSEPLELTSDRACPAAGAAEGGYDRAPFFLGGRTPAANAGDPLSIGR